MSGFQGWVGSRHIADRVRDTGSTGSVMAQMRDVFGRMLRAATTRRDLAEMDERMLKDLGISRAQAQFEASRAPWDLFDTRK